MLSERADDVTLRVDLHAHTNHSLDATTAPSDLVERALESGLDRIAVTDHGSIDGALAARELAPKLVIVGQEIRCRCRTELIGLFLTERVPDRLPMREVVERIRDQGGLIYAPHPFAYAWRPHTRARRALEVADVAEVFNGRAFLSRWNRMARLAATSRGLPQAASSDAHFPSEVGRAWTEMPSFQGPAGFLESIGSGHTVGRSTTGAGVHVVSAGLKTLRALGRWSWGSAPGWRQPSPVAVRR